MSFGMKIVKLHQMIWYCPVDFQNNNVIKRNESHDHTEKNEHNA